MPTKKPTLLYLTNLYFEAKGRRYYEEDLYLTSHLREDFDLVLCHPCDSQPFEQVVDLLVFRNTGPVSEYQADFTAFVERVKTQHLPMYNTMTGRGDQAGKGYLLELTRQAYPVIPTIAQAADLFQLPPAAQYMVKPKDGADSIGLQVVSRDELTTLDWQGKIAQPFIDFQYEVSFYYIDQQLQYALYAPDTQKRWQLAEYEPTPADTAFADQFIAWNTIAHGIQRVDACRTRQGELLLVELEDLNPYLSLALLSPARQEAFMHRFKQSLNATIESKKR
jgi:hypothetical protein